MQTLFYNVRLVDASHDGDGAVLVNDGLIIDVFWEKITPEEVMARKNISEEIEGIDGRGLALMPSFVDMHAHFRYPGQSEKEELLTALKAAVAGGFGTLVLMPNVSPVVSSAEAAAQIQAEAEKHALADVIQALSITEGFDGKTTAHLDALDGKSFPVVSEDGNDVASAATMFEAMKKCAANGALVSCHCEDSAFAESAKVARGKALELSAQPQTVKNIKAVVDLMEEANALLAMAENIATERNLLLAERAGCNVHIAHVSTAAALDAVARAKQQRGEAVSCEVTPHHLALAEKAYEFVNPPIRSRSDRAAIVQGIKDGTVDAIATDHAPHTAEDKQKGACGFSGLETAFGVCYTHLVKTKEISLSQLSALMSANPAKRLGVNCGVLCVGAQADFALVNLRHDWTVDSSKFESKGKYSPFNGKTLSGKVVQTYRRGKRVF